MIERILDGIWEGILRLEMKNVYKSDMCILMAEIVRDFIQKNKFVHPLYVNRDNRMVIDKVFGVRISTDFPYSDHILIFSPMITPLNPELLFKVDLQIKDSPMKFDIFKN